MAIALKQQTAHFLIDRGAVDSYSIKKSRFQILTKLDPSRSSFCSFIAIPRIRDR